MFFCVKGDGVGEFLFLTKLSHATFGETNNAHFYILLKCFNQVKLELGAESYQNTLKHILFLTDG